MKVGVVLVFYVLVLAVEGVAVATLGDEGQGRPDVGKRRRCAA